MKLFTLGMAAGALALSTLGAHAQTTDSGAMAGDGKTMGDKSMTGDKMMGDDKSMSGGKMMGDDKMMGMMSAPSPVSGTVTRYYVDRAGFVSAMDVQTAEGTRLVRFSPSMGQRLTTSFPVGSQISGFVSSSGKGSMMNYDLVSTGDKEPAPGMMMGMMGGSASDLDTLRAPAYTTLGAKETSVSGKLTGYVAEPLSGEVLAIILDNSTLVRVPQQSRLAQASTAPQGVTDLLKGAIVDARGVDEAPRYGAVSPYTRRIVASGISVDGRNLGTFGFGRVKESTPTIFNFNLFGGMAPKRVGMMDGGYMPYMAPGSDSSMGAGGMMNGTTGADAATGTGAAATGTGTGATGTGTGATGTGTGAMSQ